MGFLTRSERQTLTDLLLRLPNINNISARNMLVVDLPDALTQSISVDSSPAIHISNIVEAANDWEARAGEELPIALVIENALYGVRGSRLADDLQALLNELKARAGNAPGTVVSGAVAGGDGKG